MAIPAGMSAAEQAAYEAAEALIAKAAQEGSREISFDREEFRALTHIPPELSELMGLTHLDLNNTKVSDLSPIRSLTGLHHLSLNHAGVSDLAPIRDLTRLQYLSLNHTGVSDLAPVRDLTLLSVLALNHTEVSDLSPIRDLTTLLILSLEHTAVSDLRPILALNRFRYSNSAMLWLAGSRAVQLDEKLARLAAIADPEQRAKEVLAYLKTLPPWPEPLPWLTPPPVPQGRPAPLQVIVEDGILRPWMPGDGLDDSAQDLARQGWEALRDHLADLATLRTRLTNHIPNLDRALARLESALGARFEQTNAIAIGTHGQRVIRLADATGDSGMAADDVAELQAFAAALALFLERFPEWRSYRDSAAIRPVDPAKLRKTLPQIAEVERELFDRLGIDPEVPRKLADLRNLSAEAPDDPVAANGLLDSFGNIMSALADTLIKAAKKTGLGLLGLAKTAAVKGAQKIADTTYRAATWAAADILVTKGLVLRQIATNFPDGFGWIIPLLKALGL